MAGHIKTTILTTTLFVTALVGCSSSVTQQSSLPSISPTKTSLPAKVYTIIPDTPSQAPTTTIELNSTIPPISIGNPIANNIPNIGTQCLDVLNEPTEKGLGKGVVVLNALGVGYSLWNLETNEKLTIETEGFTSGNSSVSPNGELLALEKYDTENNYKSHLFIMDSSGQTTKALDGEYLETNNPAWSWLNNKQLIFNITFLHPETPGVNNPQQFLVLNPFTGEQKYLTAKFPNIFDWTGPVTTWDYPWNDSRVAYNSTLSHAVYLGEQTIKYSLWDFAKGKSVADILSLQGHSGPPRWSPDGSRFLMLGFLGDVSNLPDEFDYHLYLVSTNGSMMVLDEGLDMNLGGYFWSPSGRYVALYVYQDNYYYRLVVLDMQSMNFTDYCINFIPAGDFIELPPIWSPDESQLIIEDEIPRESIEQEFHSRLILLDFTQGTAVNIANDTQAKGWMTSSP